MHGATAATCRSASTKATCRGSAVPACCWAWESPGWWRVCPPILSTWRWPVKASGLALLCIAPAVLAGIVEDVTQRVSVRYRLGITIGSALLLCWLFKLGVSRTGLPLVDGWLQAWPYAAMLFAVLAIGGLPHAFNIIDGYNGLAGTVAVLVCLAISHVALQVGDRQLAAMVICLVGATAGFLIWNYPRGKIFAGDGGAYVWGMVIAVAVVTLVQRHRVVSPWFPMLLLIYPVWETVFSDLPQASLAASRRATPMRCISTS